MSEMSHPTTDSENDALTMVGYRRERGGVGIRNRVLVLPSVICSHVVADRIAAAVEGAVSTPHDHGCAQIGDDESQTRRTFVGIAANPNVAGALIVGLGCETLQSDGVASAIRDAGVPVARTSIQEAGGTEACYDDGVAAARSLVDQGRTTARDSVDLSALTLGIVSSDLRSSTIERADPLVGQVVERVLGHGGRVVVAGRERMRPHHEALRERATDTRVAASIDDFVSTPVVPSGGVAGIEHRAAGYAFDDVARLWDDRPIVDVLAYGERATHESGLALVNAPSSFTEATTALAAAGAQLVIHVTGDGVPVGHPVVPVLKVTGSASTYEALSDDIDLCAVDVSADDVMDALIAAVKGAPTCAERHGVTAFGISRTGPSM